MKYKAFISYRHTPLDSKAAEKIMKLVENFGIPKAIASKHNVKRHVGKLFRDEDELAAADSLSEAITSALDDSEFLIMICSPRYLESEWCALEVDHWINTNGRRNIIAVLLEGEPASSFPPQLTDYYENGRQIHMEPLAVDIRGGSEKEVLKKIEEQKFRILSPLIGCDYDELKQRQNEEAKKRTRLITAAVSAFALSIILIVSASNIKLSQKNKEIEAQRDSIEMQKNEIDAKNTELLENQRKITEQNTELEKQNNEIKKTNAEMCYESARNLSAGGMDREAILKSIEGYDYAVEVGDTALAEKLAYAAAGYDNMFGPDMLVNIFSAGAGSDILCGISVYNDELIFVENFSSSEIRDMSFNLLYTFSQNAVSTGTYTECDILDDHTVASMNNNTKEVSAYDFISGERYIFSYELPENSRYADCMFSDGKVYLACGRTVYVLDSKCRAEKEVTVNTDSDYAKITVIDSRTVICKENKGFTVYDIDSNEPLFHTDDYLYIDRVIRSGSNIIIKTSDNIRLIDLEDGKLFGELYDSDTYDNFIFRAGENGKYFAVLRDNVLEIYETASKRCQNGIKLRFKQDYGNIRDIAFGSHYAAALFDSGCIEVISFSFDDRDERGRTVIDGNYSSIYSSGDYLFYSSTTERNCCKVNRPADGGILHLHGTNKSARLNWMQPADGMLSIRQTTDDTVYDTLYDCDTLEELVTVTVPAEYSNSIYRGYMKYDRTETGDYITSQYYALYSARADAGDDPEPMMWDEIVEKNAHIPEGYEFYNYWMLQTSGESVYFCISCISAEDNTRYNYYAEEYNIADGSFVRIFDAGQSCEDWCFGNDWYAFRIKREDGIFELHIMDRSGNELAQVVSPELSYKSAGENSILYSYYDKDKGSCIIKLCSFPDGKTLFSYDAGEMSAKYSDFLTDGKYLLFNDRLLIDTESAVLVHDFGKELKERLELFSTMSLKYSSGLDAFFIMTTSYEMMCYKNGSFDNIFNISRYFGTSSDGKSILIPMLQGNKEGSQIMAVVKVNIPPAGEIMEKLRKEYVK